MDYNPLLETFSAAPVGLGWPDVIDGIAGKIERAIRRGDTNGAFKAISVLDLIDGETAAWFREYGFDLLNGSNENEGSES